MKAGFAKVKITPPVGSRVAGFGIPEDDLPSTANHDDLFVRALYITHKGEECLIMGFDLLFLGREDADRLKGAIGRILDLTPRQILLNASHTHCAPMVGIWAYADYGIPDRLYLRELETAVLEAASLARERAVEVTMSVGHTHSSLPMNRRKLTKDGVIDNLPNPGGIVYDALPICLLKTHDNQPVGLLFSVSCHPSMMPPYEMSAEFPGAAMEKLDVYLGAEASLFLQGTGGDAKPSVIGRGESDWRTGTWEDVGKAGEILAQEVIGVIESGMKETEPEIQTALTELHWPLKPIKDRDGYEAIINTPICEWKSHLWKLWANRMIERLDRGEILPDYASIIVHGIKLGKGMRIIGLEGEPVAELGILIDSFYPDGTTFPIGYTDGTGLYLIASHMVDEMGYEVRSFYEYGQPAPLAKGIEKILTQFLEELKANGID